MLTLDYDDKVAVVAAILHAAKLMRGTTSDARAVSDSVRSAFELLAEVRRQTAPPSEP